MNGEEEHLSAIGRGSWGWTWVCTCGERAEKDFSSMEYVIASARRHVKKNTGAATVFHPPIPAPAKKACTCDGAGCFKCGDAL